MKHWWRSWWWWWQGDDQMLGLGKEERQKQKAQGHRCRSLHQCLEHRAATSLLPLINAHFLLSVSLSNSLTFSDTRPQWWWGLGLTRGLIRAYLSGRHSLCPTSLMLRPRREVCGNKRWAAAEKWVGSSSMPHAGYADPITNGGPRFHSIISGKSSPNPSLAPSR